MPKFRVTIFAHRLQLAIVTPNIIHVLTIESQAYLQRWG